MVLKNEQKIAIGDFSSLQDVHLMLCAHKAFFTEWATYGIIELIRACGGHGFSHYSGLPILLQQSFPDMILEGENSVLFLQISRQVIDTLKLISQGKTDKIKGSMKGFTKLAKDYEPFEMPEDKESFKKPKNIEDIFEMVCIYIGQKTGTKMMKLVGEGHNPQDVWNYKLGSELLDLGKVQGTYIIIKNIIKNSRELKDPVLKQVFNDLFTYLSLDMIVSNMKVIIQSGALNREHVKLMRELKEELIESIAPHALVLCEGVSVDDKWLMSSIGHSNGQPYENLYNLAKSIGQLNQFTDGIHPAIKEHYLPYRQRILAKL